MTLAADFRPEAVADVLEARRWYEEQELGLGDAFAASVEEVVNRIKSMPRMYPVAHRDVRRGKLRKFPYLIYYRVHPNKLEVLAVLHGSRDPRLWRERIN
jgi:toxin ParE1/3/4